MTAESYGPVPIEPDPDTMIHASLGRTVIQACRQDSLTDTSSPPKYPKHPAATWADVTGIENANCGGTTVTGGKMGAPEPSVMSNPTAVTGSSLHWQLCRGECLHAEHDAPHGRR